MVKLSCGLKFFKFLLVLINFLAFILGITLLIVSIILVVNLPKNIDIGVLSTAPTVAAVAGSIVMVIGFLGCCGAYKENACLLTIFAIIMGLIMIVMFAAAIAAIVMKENVPGYLKKGLDKFYEKDVNTFHEIEKKFGCCGVNDGSDYKGSVPAACCSDENQSCSTSSETYYTTGCYPKLMQKFPTMYKSVAAIGFIIAIICLAGVIMSGCLVTRIRAYNEVPQQAA
ncbi:cd63 antigen [Cichlidogyrus casuarinus]|uniref:Tetraspanin n=1 Tax=Cichlidogyrus casuarinus TaxID=1844966 RepID=A0ABD2QEJ8_9PLAT